MAARALRQYPRVFVEAHRWHRAGPKLRRRRGARRFRGGGPFGGGPRAVSLEGLRHSAYLPGALPCTHRRVPAAIAVRTAVHDAARSVSHVRLRGGEPAAHHHLRGVYHSKRVALLAAVRPVHRARPAFHGRGQRAGRTSGAGAFRRPRPLDERHPALRGAAVGRAHSGHARKGPGAGLHDRRGTAEPRRFFATGAARWPTRPLLDRKRRSPHRKRATLFGCSCEYRSRPGAQRRPLRATAPHPQLP